MKYTKSDPIEIEVKGTPLGENPFYTRLEGRFTSPKGDIVRIPGFYAGNDIWKIRFSPTEKGIWTYEISSKDLPQAHGQKGTLDFSQIDEPRGGLIISKEHPHHFTFEDGSYHFMNGYECDWLWALDLGTDSLKKTKEMITQIKSHRFNTVIMNLYAHDCAWTPDYDPQYIYTPPALYCWEGTNEKPIHSRMNTNFFDHFDRVVDLLWQEGIMVHLFYKVYNKEVNYPARYSQEDDLYFKYITSRYQAYPNMVWDFSKEAKNEPDKKYILNRLNYIKSLDAYRRLVTIHDDPGFFAKEENRRSVDFFTAQQHMCYFHSALNGRLRYDMPYFNSEFQYEHGPKGIKDISFGASNTPEESIIRAWEVVLAGAYPAYYYTYTAWNTIDYSFDPPGAEYFGILYDFMTSLEWWKFEPSLELVQPNTGLSLAREDSEIVIFTGIRDRPRKDIFITADWDFTQYNGFWMDIFSGEKISVKKGNIAPNEKGIYYLPVPFESTHGVLYLKKGVN
jgi:hypothetical protein